MDRYEYLRMKLTDFPKHVQQQYNLQSHAKNGYVYLEIQRSIYGLPQAGKLANEYLWYKLLPHGYYEVSHTPGLWKHISRPIDFSLVVDDFGVKNFGEDQSRHLIDSLKEEFTISEYCKGVLYCRINLKWDYCKLTLYISMPEYIQKQLQKYKHQHSSKPQYSPYPTTLRKYGAASQEPKLQDTAPPANKEEITHIQQVLGRILYYTIAVDLTILVALSTIASKQAKATKTTLKNVHQVLDYLATNPDATIRFHASDMLLKIHSDTSYLSANNAKRFASGNFFLRSVPKYGEHITLNSAIFTLCAILKFVASSAVELELGALFMNVK